MKNNTPNFTPSMECPAPTGIRGFFIKNFQKALDKIKKKRLGLPDSKLQEATPMQNYTVDLQYKLNALISDDEPYSVGTLQGK